MTSARSNLNADIHLLDNAASRAGHLLESVAGDEAAVLARRDEIVAALALTAKPYFGELAAMTYGDVLARFRELCAIGRGRRYDDGEWGHPSWRARYEALVRAVRGAAGGRRFRPGRGRSSTMRWRRGRCCIPPTRSSSWRCATGRGSPCRSCPFWMPRSGAGTWPTGCGRRRTTGSPSTRSSSSPGRKRWPGSSARTSPSPSCWRGSRRRRSRGWLRRRCRDRAWPILARRPSRWPPCGPAGSSVSCSPRSAW